VSLSPGVRLGTYEIVEQLGAGGMGEVYRARDTSLARDVAVKVLPALFTDDAERLARFRREAQVLASLNHPNIAAVYGLEESGGAPALVMELVHGPTLVERIELGPVPVEEALGIARQICDALEAAHAKGIIHRDLKPANVKITPEGQLKVLDFGLAKALEGDESAAAPSANVSPTLTVAATRAGVILGTAAYMSPEQARGLSADQRADIWAFGAVLFEVLTGGTAFAGETVSDTLASVLKTDPDLTRLPADTPASLRRVLRRCLERDRKKRWHHIADVRIELDAGDPVAPALEARPPLRRRAWLPWAVAAVGIPLAAAAAWWLHRAPPLPVLPAAFLLAPPENAEFSSAGHAISPDGRHLIVRASHSGNDDGYHLHLREMAGTGLRELPGTAGANQTSWSPDSRSILFVQERRWKRLDIAGGLAVSLCDAGVASPMGASWSEQGTILFGLNRAPISRIPASGGVPSEVTKLDTKTDEQAHGFPHFLPGGRYFIYTSLGISTSSAFVADLENREPPRRVLDGLVWGETQFAAGPDPDTGMLLFRRESGLMGARFDLRRRVVVSEPFPVLERISTGNNGLLPLSVSVPARAMIFADDNSTARAEELALFDRSGKKVSTITTPGELAWGHLEFSPDGKRLLGNRLDGNNLNVEVWTVDLARGATSRITFEGGGDMAPAWSPDGRRVYYMSIVGANSGIKAVASNGTGKPEMLIKTTGHHIGVSPDGKYVAFEKGRQIQLLQVDKPGKAELLIGGPANLRWPQFSPDGRWIAYVSDETGRDEIYVQSFPPGNGKWQVSREGGRLARWRSDGKELVFVDGAGTVRFFSAAVRQQGAGLEFDPPVQLFESAMTLRAGGNYFAMSPDAKRFAFNLPGPIPQGRPLTVMLDWMPGVGR